MSAPDGYPAEKNELAGWLRTMATDDDMIEVARKKIEDLLVEMRDAGMFVIGGNGLVIREKDGSDSDVMRISTRMAIGIALKAIADHLDEG